MAESLVYLINSIWKGRAAAVQAERDLTNVGKAGEASEKGLKKGQSGLDSFAKTAKGLIAGGAILAIGQQLLQVGDMMIDAASDVEEAEAKFGVVFSESGPRVRAELDAFAETVGRNKFELRDYAAALGDTLKPMGLSEQAAANFSVQLVQLATDLSSFNNMPMDEALRRLQGTLIGSHENALAFGVVINENTLKAELAANGWDKLTGAQLEQAKVQARINLLMAGTADAQGDAARTADGYANQSRNLEAAMSELAVAIGERLLPAATDLKSELAEIVRLNVETIESENEFKAAIEDGGKALLLNEDALAAYNTKLEEMEGRYPGVNVNLTAHEHALRAAFEAYKESGEELADLTAKNKEFRTGLELTNAELGAWQARMAQAQEPTENYRDKIREMALEMPGLADAFNEWAGNIDSANESLAAANPTASETSGLIGAINSQIERLGNRHDWILNLDVQGLSGLQEAIQAASTFGGLDVDPIKYTEAGSQPTDPYEGLSGEAIDQPPSTPTSSLPPGAFQFGGIFNRPLGQAGLAILHGQEEVLRPDDPRHRRNLRSSAGDTINIYTMDRSDLVVAQMQRRQRERRLTGL